MGVALLIYKKADWQIILFARANALKGRDFYWGLSDCVMLSLMCLDTMCGTSLWEETKDTWCNRREAIKYKKEHGGFYQWLTMHGATEKPALDLMTGDFIFEDTNLFLENVGLVLDSEAVLTSNEKDGVIAVEHISQFGTTPKVLYIPTATEARA